MPTLAATWHLGEVFLVFLEFAMFFILIWLLITVFADLFRSHDISGWVKALWCLFIIVLPFLGVFVYLIARGSKMSQHAMDDAKRVDQAQRAYIQSVTSTASSPVETPATSMASSGSALRRIR